MNEPNWQWLRSCRLPGMGPADMARMVLATYLHEKNNDQPQIPVPVREIVNWLGVDLYEFAHKCPQSAFLVNPKLDPTSKPVITIHSGHTEEQKRFGLAHQLGHLMLHNTDRNYDMEPLVREPDPRPWWKRLFTKRPMTKDEEANEFAAALLMPAGWILGDVFKYEVNLKKFAHKYQVTETAMLYRLRVSLKVY